MSVSSLELSPMTAAPAACPTPNIQSHAPPEITRPEAFLVNDRAGRRAVGLEILGRTWLERFHSAPELLYLATKVWLKQDRNRRAALVEADLGGRPTMWFLKETVTRSWWVRFVVQLAEFRSSNAWKQGRALRAVNISTPRPLALATFTSNGTYHEYFLTEVVSDSVNLGHWLGRSRQPSAFSHLILQRRSIARDLGSLLRRLHEQRFDHRDLKPSNILVSDVDSGLKLWLIDLDGVWRWPLLPRLRRIQNLARLWIGVSRTQAVTATDALRFLKVYLGPEREDAWKPLWKQVLRRAASKLRNQLVHNSFFSPPGEK